MTTDLEERELRHIGRRLAESLEPTAGRAIPAARRKLFEEPREAPSLGGRWVMGVAAVGAVAAVAFALRGSDPAPSRTSAKGGATTTEVAVATDGIRPMGDAVSRVETRPDGASELMLESGEARGIIGREGGPRSVAAGPYRVTGEAEVLVRWSATEGLTVEVTQGEARVLSPGQAPIIVSRSTSKTLPGKP